MIVTNEQNTRFDTPSVREQYLQVSECLLLIDKVLLEVVLLVVDPDFVSL